MYHTLVQATPQVTLAIRIPGRRRYPVGTVVTVDCYRTDTFWWETVQQQHVQAQENSNLNCHRTPALQVLNTKQIIFILYFIVYLRKREY